MVPIPITMSQIGVDRKYHAATGIVRSRQVCTARNAPSTTTPATASGACTAREGSTVTARASSGFRDGSASTESAISRKFTSIEVTRMSTPRKKSPAR